jgi:hypothetical protein
MRIVQLRKSPIIIAKKGKRGARYRNDGNGATRDSAIRFSKIKNTIKEIPFKNTDSFICGILLMCNQLMRAAPRRTIKRKTENTYCRISYRKECSLKII